MNHKYMIPDISAKIIVETIEGLKQSPRPFTDEDVASYIDKTPAAANRALTVSMQLNIAKRINSGYMLSDVAKNLLNNDKDERELFGLFLNKYLPFIKFIHFIVKGNTRNTAAQKIKILYDIQSSTEIIAKSMTNWGIYVNILKNNKKNIELNSNVENTPNKHMENIFKHIQNDAEPRLFIMDRLDDETFEYLCDDEISYIIKSIQRYTSSPRTAINDCGRAFEDVLRRIATAECENADNCQGIQGLSDMLKSNNKITIKHLECCKAINSIRNSAVHGKDKNSRKSWILSSDVALTFILFVLILIKSIYNYIFKKQTQIF